MLILVMGCASMHEQRFEMEGEQHKMIVCPESRPQIYTREYRPVCAQMRDGSFKTFATGCTACADQDMTVYRDGSCE